MVTKFEVQYGFGGTSIDQSDFEFEANCGIKNRIGTQKGISDPQTQLLPRVASFEQRFYGKSQTKILVHSF